MVTKGMSKIGWVWLLIICQAGCAISTDFNENGNSMPNVWAIEAPHESKECVSIDGVYQIHGLGKLKEGDSLIEIRLDVVLGHAFPSNKIPNQVSMSIDEDMSLLNYQFGYPVNQSLSVSVICSNGWYKLEKRLTNQYVGDGANLDYSNRNIELGKTADGDLIIHLMLETQFSSFLVLKSHATREIWSRYERLKGEN